MARKTATQLAAALAILLAACGSSSTAHSSGAASDAAAASATPSPSVAATPSASGAAIPSPLPLNIPPGVHRGTPSGGAPAGFPAMTTPAVGTFPARFSGSDPKGVGSGTVVVAHSSTPGQLQLTINTPEGSDKNELAWRTDGVYLVSTKLAAPDGKSADCTWDPAILDLQLPLAVGVQWSSNSSCTVSTQYGPGTVHEETTSRITGTSSLVVGGTTVPVYSIDSTTRLTFSSTALNFSATSVGTDWLAPGYGLIVKSTRSTTNSLNSQPNESAMELTSVRPS